MSDRPSPLELTHVSAHEAPQLISHLDEHRLWFFAKPAGWLSHPDGSERPDLISWARTRSEYPASLTLVHRLDFGTSGVLCCAGDPEVAARWGVLWAEGLISKRYLALVEGKVSENGTISRALKDGRRGRPLKAKTRYRRLLALKGCALIEVSLEQGRKHQIRRHLQGIGSGVVGDKRYPPHRRTPLRGAPDRLWLHAASLTLPVGVERVTVNAPLPYELSAHLEAISGLEALSSLRASLGGLL